MASENLEIANEILRQLGGTGRLSVMIGARDFVALDRGVQFRIGRGANEKINKIVIKLDQSDTYWVSFYRGTGAHVRQVGETATEIYVENLREVIERATGFHLSLGTMRGAP